MPFVVKFFFPSFSSKIRQQKISSKLTQKNYTKKGIAIPFLFKKRPPKYTTDYKSFTKSPLTCL